MKKTIILLSTLLLLLPLSLSLSDRGKSIELQLVDLL
jgi:hypothetical protein